MFRKALYWFIVTTLLAVAGFLLFERSLLSDMVVFIWVISGIATLYIAKTNKNPKVLSKKDRILFIAIGLLVAAFSFINLFLGPKFFWSQPFSLAAYGMLLSGLSIAFFAALGYRQLLLPSAAPAAIMVCAQLYNKYRSIVDVVATPLLGPTSGIVVYILNLIGIPASIAPDYIIEFMSKTGDLIRIQIVIDCTGVWSLSAFTASLLIVSIAFPKIFSKKNAGFLLLGYAGTYTANILRVLAICVSGYEYGYNGVVEKIHEYAGWVAFSGWMLIFWYLFFSRRLLKKENDGDKQSSLSLQSK